MKKIKRALYIYLIFLFLSVITSACCKTNYQIIGNGSITAYDSESGETFTEDIIGTIIGGFRIDVNHEISIATGTDFNLSFIQSAYATSCGENYENDLDGSTLKISTNKDFIYDGILIEQGSNLTDIEGLDYDFGFGGISVRFNEEFVNRMEFINEVYEFKFEISTTDGMELVNIINLKFEIE
ncbi:hypothetical protein [Mariniflexile sp. HMF6888]|uniref:hypothetical protein n=1 Tax=Mariniflexile sp. HMF6888 TaxID=3373086 RepID=UPI00379D2167